MKTFNFIPAIYRYLSAFRKRQLLLVFVLMALGAVSEAVTLGAIMPFVSIMFGMNDYSSSGHILPLIGYFGFVEPADFALAITLLLVSAALFSGIVRVSLTWASNAFVYGLANDLNTRAFSNILHQPYAYHLEHNSSNTVGSINKIQTVTNNVIFHTIRAAVSVVMAAVILAFLLIVEPVIAFTSMVAIGLVFLSVRFSAARVLSHNGRIISQMQTKRIQAVQEGTGGIREVIIDRAENFFVDKFREYDRGLQNAHVVNFSIARTPRYIVESIGIAIIAFVALMMVSGPGGSTSALPVLGLLAVGAQRLLPLLQDINQAWVHISGNRQVICDLMEILQLPEKQAYDVTAALGNDSSVGTISLKGVGFRYSVDQDFVLRGINLTFPKGTTVGIIGKTGSGKSTLIDLLMGLLQPEEGKILIDGDVLTPENSRAWHGQIAHVPQSIFLKDATIAENIAFGIEPSEIDFQRVEKVSDIAQVSSFVRDLPGGFGTMVGERGVKLSGGQRQRIGLARALYKDAKVLVLDEATNALDSETELAVLEGIGKLSKEITIFMVTHRASTLSCCDCVLNVENGMVFDHPEHDCHSQPKQIQPEGSTLSWGNIAPGKSSVASQRESLVGACEVRSRFNDER